uniref:Uncharacterized protein n=1 Tax=Knipowitschia caucasica TaxID=637954 RepID=A0AAV2KHJ3_KNICA
MLTLTREENRNIHSGRPTAEDPEDTQLQPAPSATLIGWRKLILVFAVVMQISSVSILVSSVLMLTRQSGHRRSWARGDAGRGARRGRACRAVLWVDVGRAGGLGSTWVLARASAVTGSRRKWCVQGKFQAPFDVNSAATEAARGSGRKAKAV